MRVAFFGTPSVAVPSFEALLGADDIDVAAAITNPDRARGRSRQAVPPPVKVAAEAADVPVWQPQKAAEILEELVALEVDACAVVAYGALLPRRVLDATATGFVNLHFSLLPRWRGAAPVQHAIRNGDRVTGVSTFVLDEGMDTGPLLDQLEVAIGPDETAGDLLERLARLGAPVLVDSVRRLVHGASPTPQPQQGATLAPKIIPDDVAIDWTASAGQIVDLVRSAAPTPGAHTVANGRRLKVLRVSPVPTASEQAEATQRPAAPGVVVAVAPDGVVVAAAEGAVRLDRVQPEGKAAMDGASYANGYRPQLGAPLAEGW